MTAALERRYGRLLRLYPRTARRDEMLDTALQVADDGRRWPPVRETASLLLGAVRARTGADVHRTPAQFARSGVRLAALLLLASALGADLLTALSFDVLPMAAALIAAVGHAGALIMLAGGQPGQATAWALGGLAAWLLSNLGEPWWWTAAHPEFWPAAVVVPVLIALAVNGSPERSRAVPWLLAAPLTVVLLPSSWSIGVNGPAGLQPAAALVVLGLTLAWSLVDARAAVALAGPAVSYLVWYVAPIADWYRSAGDAAAGVAIAAAPAVLLLAAGLALGRRGARL